jgi:Lrp/AsnC family transcriptional regulator for asnA, asnC and gidA
MDELDLKIMRFLRRDGRMSYTSIAEELGVAEGTVRNRVGKLRESKALQIVGMVDPHRMGYEAPAMIGINVQPPYLDSAAIEIASLPEVSYLILVSGEFDLIVEVMCRDREHLAGFLRDTLHAVVGIQRTQTFMILHTYKMALGAQAVFDATDSVETGSERTVA